MIDVGQHLSTSLRAQCSLLLSMCLEHTWKTLFHFFLVHLCPGFASLLFPAHFLKSPSRTLQSARPSRTHTDQRCAHTHRCKCTHARTHTPCLPCSICLTLQWFPVPCRPLMRCTISLHFLPSPALEDLRTAWQESSDRSQHSGLLILLLQNQHPNE